MGKLQEGFSQMTKAEKIAFVVGQTGSVLVIILAVLMLTGIWPGALWLCELMIGVIMAAQAVAQWKRNRAVAICSVCVSVFIFILVGYMIFR